MRRLPRSPCNAPLPPDRPRPRARARARAHEEPGGHRRGDLSVLLPLTVGGAVGATATAWAGGSATVPVIATLCAVVAVGLLATPRGALRRAVTTLRGPGGAALPCAAQRVTAALLLALVLPILLIVALAVELTSRGPVLLRRARAGSGSMLTFRCTDRRGRTTRLGGVLRRSSLEGLPGLLDVVAGRMALPGPPLARSAAASPRRGGGRVARR